LDDEPRRQAIAPFARPVGTAARCAFCASAIPLAVVLGLAVITLLTYYNPLRSIAKLPINLNDLVVSGTKVTWRSAYVRLHPRRPRL